MLFPDQHNNNEDEDFLSFPFTFPGDNNANNTPQGRNDDVDDFFLNSTVVVGPSNISDSHVLSASDDDNDHDDPAAESRAPTCSHRDAAARLAALEHKTSQLFLLGDASYNSRTTTNNRASVTTCTTTTTDGTSASRISQQQQQLTLLNSSAENLSQNPLFASFLQNPHILQFVKNEKIDLNNPDSVNRLLSQIISKISDPNSKLNQEHVLPDDFGVSNGSISTSVPIAASLQQLYQQHQQQQRVQYNSTAIMSPYYAEYVSAPNQPGLLQVAPSAMSVADLTPPPRSPPKSPSIRRQSKSPVDMGRSQVREPTIRYVPPPAYYDEDEDEMEIVDEDQDAPLPYLTPKARSTSSRKKKSPKSKKKKKSPSPVASKKTAGTPPAKTAQRKSKPVFSSDISEDYLKLTSFSKPTFDVKLKPARRLNTEYASEFPKEMCSKPYKYLLAIRSKNKTDFTFFLTLQNKRDSEEYVQLSPIEHSSSTGVQVQLVRQSQQKSGDVLQIYYVKFLETSFKNNKKMFKLNIVDKELGRFQSSPVKLVARRSKSDGQDKFWAAREKKTGRLAKSKAKPKNGDKSHGGKKKKNHEEEDDMDENPFTDEDEDEEELGETVAAKDEEEYIPEEEEASVPETGESKSARKRKREPSTSSGDKKRASKRHKS
uniref:Uncharacterized protein n=1 Tax=Percolomonas cosmopolitus TaxID=63605 RepID=A0A7S1PER3_9EUKA|mmetsp:Transcript_1825/g.6470  ORF Transcript_1825/g.6470 Transcript_1825/m.6470 type:complete len:657 (+) Transcript_1825:254-2224(+)|eukprot:CAMPEP_0117434794 /NCGR_PEP_ID=MMETSP0759-20121206/135_1 /TAXON_ID=63605 /ORGANISM="Percolomonas cosmopolitus, Strain WS" /LENGTH=656 /DNA_ID=CAMNT_0005226293 /DNA_START=250 /DNA_END=2220 /DNA_ORIENTATION=+